ncbi:NAD(P)/FAD-dependent oxidoreductase [Negadavirga shengliensis]|uniref:NAD(P)/FAD-dependent oxidoreductase n=1 Tax=Negadavirga shengliensis TaxID=1389218 RepID=A0ABV9T0I5_9BACT
MNKIGVIGGGAAGFFAAIHAAVSGHKVIIFEKTSKILSKVKVSGGGRCNVTNDCYEISNLIKGYPRGNKFLKKSFQHFNVKDTITWFEDRGVQLKIEPDGRVFPVSDNSASIIEVLVNESRKYKVEILKHHSIDAVVFRNQTFELEAGQKSYTVDKLVVSMGGSPKPEAYDFIRKLGHSVISPIPSLFTFNLPDEPITQLKGISLPDSMIRLEGSKLSYSGPLLITHWGISGPAVLKLSAFGAAFLHDKAYKAVALIRWRHDFTEEGLRQDLFAFREGHPKKKIASNPMFNLPARLWGFLVGQSGIAASASWRDSSKKEVNKLVEYLFKYPLNICGKTTFKEEFVTAGGVCLEEVNPHTMESRMVPGLFFAGEVLNMDGITGGYNFQAAWTTGYLAGINASND